MSAMDRNDLSPSIAERISQLIEAGETAVLVTLIAASENVGAKLLIENGNQIIGNLGNPDLTAAVIDQVAKFLNSRKDIQHFQVNEFAASLLAFSDSEVLFERIQPEARVVICGAGHVGAALANLASVMGYRSTLIDDRNEFVSRERFPDHNVTLVLAEKWFDAVSAAVGDGHGVAVAVVTRGHSEDEVCMRAIMNSTPDYVGMIGSKRRTRIVLDRLRANGANEEALEKVHAPIGLDIGAVSPEEVALAIMAEIVSVRRGGEGASLSKAQRRTVK